MKNIFYIKESDLFAVGNKKDRQYLTIHKASPLINDIFIKNNQHFTKKQILDKVETGEIATFENIYEFLEVFNKLNYTKIPTPNFNKFIKNSFSEKDFDKKVRFFQQWLGYLMCSDFPEDRKKTLIIVDKGTGREFVMNHFLQKFLREHIVFTSLKNFNEAINGKGRNLAFGKRAVWFYGFGGKLREFNTKMFNDLISNKDINPTSKIIYLSTKDVDLSNLSKEVKDNIHIIEFDNFDFKFNTTEEEVEVEEGLYSELQGIRFWAMEGLEDLKKNGWII